MNIHRKTLEALHAGITSGLDENQIIQFDEQPELDSVDDWEPRSQTWEAAMPTDTASKAKYIFDEVLRMYEQGQMSGNWRYVGDRLSAEQEQVNARAENAAAIIQAAREEIHPPNGSLPESERLGKEIQRRKDFCLNIPAGDSKEVAFAMADLGKEHHLPVHVVAIEDRRPDSSGGRGSTAMHYVALVAESQDYIQRVAYRGTLEGLPQERSWVADVSTGTFDTLSGYRESVVAMGEARARDGLEIRHAQDQGFFKANDERWVAALRSFPDNAKVHEVGYRSIEDLEVARGLALEREAREGPTHVHERESR